MSANDCTCQSAICTCAERAATFMAEVSTGALAEARATVFPVVEEPGDERARPTGQREGEGT